MGAQTDDRLIQYKKRFKDWEDPNGESKTPAQDLWVVLIMQTFLNMFLFLHRRDSGVSLRHPLLLCNDRGLISGQNGAVHTDLPQASGSSWHSLCFSYSCWEFFHQLWGKDGKKYNLLEKVFFMRLDWGQDLDRTVLSLFSHSSTPIVMQVEMDFVINVSK